MSQANLPSLSYFLDRYKSNFSIQIISASLNSLVSDDSYNINNLIDLYDDAIALIEQRLWSDEPDEKDINEYQKLFHELETLISQSESDDRYSFIIAIPVADRPQHLESCLQSLLNLCKYFNYGGIKDNQFSKIYVLIADDSKYEESITANKGLVRQFSQQGLKIEYFGQQEQKQVLSRSQNTKDLLHNITGDLDEDAFYHKGASITRNISYLKLNELNKNITEPVLFYFIDSDQEFQIKVQGQDEDKYLYAVNYFYYLDKIFSKKDICILTGKVVGDPPVSPSVMVSNFLEDLIFFVSRMAEFKKDQSCQFHDHSHKNIDDASYHDMAELFGFKSSIDSCQYNCEIKGKHDHAQCFKEFAARLNSFFDGAHLTRKSYYQHEDVLANIESARTVYTGNYVFKSEGLKFFIPFANLKLRMAGPVLGRIIKAEIADQFVSVNLPMLHQRTVNTTGKSEFRPGIERKQDVIDLSGEFIRQFFGDVMLFSMEKLTASGYPKKTLPVSEVSKVIENIIVEMRKKYGIKHKEIIIRIETFKTLINHAESWWNQSEDMQDSKKDFTEFIGNIERNFGVRSIGYDFINSENNINTYHGDILTAIMAYTDDIEKWQAILDGMKK